MTAEQIVPLLVSIVALVGSGFASMLVYRATRKGDKAKTKLEERRDTVADRDDLIDQLQEDVARLSSDVTALRSEVAQVRDHNNALITYCYRLIAVIRRHGHTDDIPTPPPSGIHI